MTEKKQYAIADEVPEGCDYLTAGKAYEIEREHSGYFTIIDDYGFTQGAFGKYSCHLEGGNWRIIDEDDLPEQKDTDQ